MFNVEIIGKSISIVECFKYDNHTSKKVFVIKLNKRVKMYFLCAAIGQYIHFIKYSNIKMVTHHYPQYVAV